MLEWINVKLQRKKERMEIKDLTQKVSHFGKSGVVENYTDR